jgi:hypothetical protein
VFIELGELLDLDIHIAGVPQRAGDPPDLIQPGFGFLSGQAFFEQVQTISQPAGCDPHPVDSFDVLPYLDTFHFILQALHLLEHKTRAEYTNGFRDFFAHGDCLRKSNREGSK